MKYFLQQEAVGRDEDGNKQESLQHLQTRSTFGEISVLGDIPEPYTIRVRELCRLLRLDKHSCIELLETHFHDGRIILDNLLEVTYYKAFHLVVLPFT